MIQLGIETLLKEKMAILKGKRIGLLTNRTGLDSRLHSTIDLLNEQSGCRLTALFGPEHGIRGDGREGSAVASSVDPPTGLPVYSLYGKTRKPTAAMLDRVDCIVVDLQDIGARYYTFISTLSLVMEACMEIDKEVVVLDRPNPIGGLVREGNLTEPQLTSFVGLHALPNRHGLTIGELALVYKYEFGLNCPLQIVPMNGWDRSMFYHQTGFCWVQPSPNATGEDMAVLYPGMCLIEGTMLSEGRGTTRPFEVVGAPYIDGAALARRFNGLGLPGVLARPTSFVPTYAKYAGTLCRGVQIHIIDQKTVRGYRTGLSVLGLIASMYPGDFQFRGQGTHDMFDLLAGTTKLKNMVLTNRFNDFFEQCQDASRRFGKRVAPYLFY